MPKVVAIKHIDPSRADEEPVRTPKGYQLVSRRIPYPARNLNDSATFVGTYEEAADLIEQDHGIRMGTPGAKRGNYIYPKDLRIVRA